MTTAFIDFFAKIGKHEHICHWHLNITVSTRIRDLIVFDISFIGWAYDLKSVSDEVVAKRMARIGDGNTKYSKVNLENLTRTDDVQESIEGENLVWGWDDADMDQDIKSSATIINKTE